MSSHSVHLSFSLQAIRFLCIFFMVLLILCCWYNICWVKGMFCSIWYSMSNNLWHCSAVFCNVSFTVNWKSSLCIAENSLSFLYFWIDLRTLIDPTHYGFGHYFLMNVDFDYYSHYFWSLNRRLNLLCYYFLMLWLNYCLENRMELKLDSNLVRVRRYSFLSNLSNLLVH